MFGMFKKQQRCKEGYSRKGDRCVKKNHTSKNSENPKTCSIDGKNFCKEEDKPLKGPISYFGGKSKLADKIIGNMREHDVYVEPFAGGAAVYYKKPLASKNVINDKDRNIANIHKTLKKNPNVLKKCDMTLSKDKFNRIKNKGQKTTCEFLYLNKLSYGGLMESPVTCSNPENKEACEKRWSKNKDKGMTYVKAHTNDYKNKLKSTTVTNQDFRTVMKKYDSKKTLHYLDPPYVVGGDSYKVHGITPEEVCGTAKKMKGKVIISYDDRKEVRKGCKGLKMKKVKTSYTIDRNNPHKKANELLITNY